MKGYPTAKYRIEEEREPPRGDLYELDQTIQYRVIENGSDTVILTYRATLEADLSPDSGTWENLRVSGVRAVELAADGQAVLVSYYDGHTDVVALP